MAALAWMSIERRQCETNRLHGVDLVMAVKEARLLGWPQVIMWPQQAFKPARRRFPVSHYAERAKDSKTAIAPMLSVRSGAKAVEFYKAQFRAPAVVFPQYHAGRILAVSGVMCSNFGFINIPTGLYCLCVKTIASTTKAPEATRRKIPGAAFAEFYKNGFQGGSLSHIVKVAGTTKGALFHHFSGKQELGYAVGGEIIAPSTQPT